MSVKSLRRTRRLALCAIAGLLLSCGPHQTISVAQAQSSTGATYKVGDLVIAAPWTREPPKGARVAGGFMKITNSGKSSDRLVGGTAAFAKRFEVHEMAMDGGVMKMRELSKGLEIKAGETVELKPGGYHLMFMDLTSAPTPGTAAKIKLRFDVAGEIEVELPVTAAGNANPPSGHKPSGHKH